MDSQIFDRAKAMKSLLNQASPSLCLAKWYQVTLFLQNGYSSSCHHVRAHKISKRAIKIDPSALHNTEYKKWMRRLMKKGRFPKECRYCWNIEKLGKLSDRHYKSSEDWANPKFNRVVDSAWNQNVNPTNLEVVFGNHCNFKCSYCNPISSSRWQKEQRESGDFAVATNPYKAWKRKLKGNYIYDTEELNPYVEAFWQWWPDLVNSLKVFRITGGEPLLNPNTWRVIDYFIENPRPDLVFEINSNLGVSSVLVNKLVDKVNQLSGKVRFFNLYTSVDNVGARAEYIRNGLDYKLYCRNVEHYLAHTKGNVALSYMITMNLLCLGGQKKLFCKNI